MGEEKKNHSMVKNAADKKQVEKAAKDEKFIREQELFDLSSMLSTKQGRRFLFRLVNDLCHYDKDDFNNSGSITFRSLGERNIGRIVKGGCAEADHEMWQLAEKENWLFLQSKGD